jgi:hypothetical protein
MGSSRTEERLAPTAEQAARRIAELRHVYDQGYLARGTYETLKRIIEARVKPTRPSRPS